MNETIEFNSIIKQSEDLHLGEATYKKEICINKVKELLGNKKKVIASGFVEILPEGFGFLRTQGFFSGQADLYISHQIIRKNDLRAADKITCSITMPKENDKNLSVAEVISVNNQKPGYSRVRFESLEALYPNEQLKLECDKLPANRNISMRILDIFAPIGKGQRAICIAPPRTGKTELLHSIAFSVRNNYPDIILMVILIDERPEEVMLMKEVAGAENVFASTFDEPLSKHVQTVKLAVERGKRLTEMGYDVVGIVDSITRTARALNQTVQSSGKPGTGGVEQAALHQAKQLVGAGRNTHKGSFTLIFSVLTETGSKMDDVIAEEFKGTCNAEIILDRQLAMKRIFPAFDIDSSGTRREEFLLKPNNLQMITTLRKVLKASQKSESLELIIDRMKKTKNNDEFFKTMNG